GSYAMLNCAHCRTPSKVIEPRPSGRVALCPTASSSALPAAGFALLLTSSWVILLTSSEYTLCDPLPFMPRSPAYAARISLGFCAAGKTDAGIEPGSWTAVGSSQP